MTRRTILAFAGAPLVSAILYAFWAQISSRLTRPGEFWVTIAVAYFYSLIGTVIAALPAFLVLRRFGLVRWWSALIAGAALGLLFCRLLGTNDIAWCEAVIGIGAVSGVTFWLAGWARDTDVSSS